MSPHLRCRRYRRLLAGTALVVSLTGLAAVSHPFIARADTNVLPQGGTVVVGAATIRSTSPGSLDVTTATQHTAIDWQSFSIGANNRVDINQPNASALTLNQVVGSDPSQIFGILHSNGQVVLANPNGIWFGPGSHVDVASIVASTATASTAALNAFARGGALMLDQAGRADAAIVNDGSISIGAEGLAGLVAPGVANNGIIRAQLGRVVLASGTVATLDFYGDGLISFAVGGSVTAVAKDQAGKALSAAVVNSGTINNAGGTVLLTAAAAKTVVDNTINMSGVVVASAVSTKGGEIDLDGGSGTINVSGELLASSQTATGGTINATGHSVVVAPTARLDVTGATGGSVAIGGGLHGGGSLAHATSVTLASGSTITADATAGKGGTVAVWSDGDTVAAGTITATGPAGGGMVETSGEFLRIDGIAVKAGNWLLEPISVELTSSDQATISTALNNGTSVSIATSAGSAPTGGFGTSLTSDTAGDIVVDADATGIAWSTTASLTLNAYGAVIVASGAKVANTGAGSITLSGASGIDVSGNIATAGHIELSGGVTLTGDTALTAATVTFAGTVDGPHALIINGDADFEGNIGDDPYVYHPVNSSPTSLVVTGTAVIDAATIITNGPQEYHGAVTLKTSTGLRTDENDITFDSSIDDGNAAGTDGLALGVGIGTATLRGAVGDIAPLASLYVGGVTVLPERISTVGAQTYGGTMILATDTTLTGAGLLLYSVNGGSHALEVDASAGGVTLGTMTLGSLVVNSSGPVVLYPGSVYTIGSTLSLGPVTIYGPVEFDQPTSLGAVTLATTSYFDPNVPGLEMIIAARDGITFTSTVDGATPLTIRGDAVFDGAVGGVSPPTSLLVTGASTIDTSAITTSGILDLQGSITLLADTVLNGSQATLGQVTGGTNGLSVNAGQGTVTLNGVVSGGLTLDAGSVTLNSGTYTIGTSPLVLGDVSLNGDLHFGQATSFGRIVLVGSTDLTGPAFSFNGTIDGADSQFVENETNGYVSVTRVGEESLAVFGSAIFNAGVGTTTILQGLSVAGDATINTGAITVSGSQTFQGSVTLSRDVGLSGARVAFAGPVDGANGLSIIGDASFGGTVGGAVPLATLDVSGTTTITASTVSIVTTGSQNFHGAIAAANTTVILTSGAGQIALAGVAAAALNLNSPDPVLLRSGIYNLGSGPYSFGTVEASGNIILGQATGFGRIITDGVNFSGPDLVFHSTIDGNSFFTVTGHAEFDGAIGGVESLTAFSGFGNVVMNAPSVTATGNILFQGPVMLGRDAIIAAPNITFGGSVDGAHALTVNGAAEFDDVVGGVVPLASLDINGSALLLGPSVTTTGPQTYHGTVSIVPPPPLPNAGGDSGGFYVGVFSAQGATLLPLDPALAGSTIRFDGTVDGGRILTIVGDAVFAGSVGGITPLASLEITGNASLRSVTTTGAQRYGSGVSLDGSYLASVFTAPGAVTIAGPTAIDASAGVALGTVTSGQSILINGQSVSPLALSVSQLTLPASVLDPAAGIPLPADWRAAPQRDDFILDFAGADPLSAPRGTKR